MTTRESLERGGEFARQLDPNLVRIHGHAGLVDRSDQRLLHALQLLRDAGLIFTVAKRGSYVGRRD